MFNETEFVQFALPFFVKALGLTEDDIKEKSMTSQGQEELQKLYGDSRKTAKSEGYKEAEGKVQKLLNKQAKDLFGVETDAKTIEETIKAIKDGYQPGGENTEELTENAVKRHPLFLRMETAKKDVETELNNTKADFDKRLKTAIDTGISTINLQTQAERDLDKLKAKLPEHAGQRSLLVGKFREMFAGLEERKVDGKSYYYDSEGNREEDNMGTPLDWDGVVRKKAGTLFEFDAPERESPEAKPQQQQQQDNRNKNVNLNPKTVNDLNTVLTNASVSAEDKAKAKAFYKSNATDLQD